MTPFEKKKNELAKEAALYDDYACDSETPFKSGFDAMYAEHERIVKELVKALESSKSCFSCIRHNCRPDMFMLAIDVGSQVTMKHIDFSQKMVTEALEAYKRECGQ